MQTKLSALLSCLCIGFVLLFWTGPATADSVLGVVLKENRHALSVGSGRAPVGFNPPSNFDPLIGFNNPQAMNIDFESPVFPNAEPVPIPGPLLLLASGLAGFFGLRWRQRKR